jgi:DNA-binding transcriptional MerR regulator
MEMIPIGQAAARLGMSASALRYYDERKLVCPSSRHAGKRMYSAEQLRRLPFIKIANRLGLPLQTSAAVLDAPARSGARLFGSRSPSWTRSSHRRRQPRPF